MPECRVDMGPDPQKLMLVGDTHRDYRFLKRVVAKAVAEGVDVIFQLGDFGFWPTGDDGTFMDDVDRLVDGNDIRFYWIDGNHEEFSALVPGDRWGKHVQHVPRGHRWQWWNKTWMGVGGVSVDKKSRTPMLDWFVEEELSSVDVRHCCRSGDVDVVLSHDCPDAVEIPGLKPGLFPIEAIHASERHRMVLGGICDAVVPDLLYHGHYHHAYTALRHNVTGKPTHIQGLADNRDCLENAVIVLTKENV